MKKAGKIGKNFLIFIIWFYLSFGLFTALLGWHTIDNGWNLRNVIEKTNITLWVDCNYNESSCLSPDELYGMGMIFWFTGLFLFGYGCLLFGRYVNPP